MKTITATIFLITLVLTAVALGCQTASTKIADNNPAPNVVPTNVATQAEATPADDAPRISLADAKAAFDTGGALFIDTRASASYDAEHIKGALNIPMDKLADRIKDLPRDKKIVAYCS